MIIKMSWNIDITHPLISHGSLLSRQYFCLDISKTEMIRVAGKNPRFVRFWITDDEQNLQHANLSIQDGDEALVNELPPESGYSNQVRSANDPDGYSP
jgi:hypothetical protein